MTAGTELRDVAIIGSGPAGLTAGVYAARANLRPVLFAGVEWGGQLMITTDVENYPGFPDGVQGPDLMELMRKQAERFGTEIITADVTSVDFSSHPFGINTGENEVRANAVLVTTGAVARKLGVPGEDRYIGRGLSYCATCDGFFFRDQEIVVIGGGDTAVEEALFLTRFGSKVTIVHRRDELRASKIMADRAFANAKIEFLWDTVATEAVGEDDQLTGIRTRNVLSGDEGFLSAGGLFVAIGHDPATTIFGMPGIRHEESRQLDVDDQGYIRVRANSSYTSIEGVFAGGDCVDHVYRQAVTAAAMGCMAAIDAERWLESRAH